MTYSEKLKDQRWQKKRLELLDAANWKCQRGNCHNPKDKPTLHVHHRVYLRNHDPWDYPDFAYTVLCDACHGVEQSHMERSHLAIATDRDLMLACVILQAGSDESLHSVGKMLMRIVHRKDSSVECAVSAINAVLDLADHAFTEIKDAT